MKLYNTLNNIKNNNLVDIKTSTSSILYIVDNTIEFEINGTPSNILITYSGAGNFMSKMPIDIKVKIGKSTILISNVFKKDIPKVILEYSGNITINSCQVMNFDGSKIRSIINNSQNEQLLDKSKTNMEDDTLILYDEPKTKISRSSSNSKLIKPRIKPNAINKFGKIQKYGKSEIETISNIIKQRVPAKQKQAFAVKEIAKPQRERIIKEPKPTKQTNTIKYEGGKK